MNIKNYMLIGVLMLISVMVIIKGSLTQDKYIGSEQALLIISGQKIQINVDVYQSLGGEQHFEIKAPVTVKSFHPYLIKQ